MDRLSLDRFSGLIEAAAAVAGQVELRSVLTTTVHTAAEATGAKYAAIGVLGEHGVLIDFIFHGISQAEALEIGHPPVGKGVLGVLIDDPQPIRLDHIKDHPASSGFPPNHPPMSSFLGAPVRSADQIFGNLYLAEKPGGFSDWDQQLVEALAAIAGSAVSAARLHDRLTRAALAEDRERIARDLHDSVIQDLFATGLGLQSLAMATNDSRTAERLDEAVDRIDVAIAALRSFIFDIRTFEKTMIDPDRTVGRMVERLIGGRGVDVQLDVDQLSTCAPDLLDDVLATIRESVSNAVRHGSPGSISIRADVTARGVTLQVSDDGIGFDPATVERGMGIENLTNRAAGRSGILTIESAPGSGTKVTAELPI
jgi:signal transduction histidine kinase